MKELYLKIKNLLLSVDGLKYVDLDYGQLEVAPPAVNFPCALINISFPDCQDTVDHQQRVRAIISIRLGFNAFSDQTSSSFGDDKIEVALNYFDVVGAVYKKLQSYYDDDIEELSRKSLQQEKRHDALKVSIMPFETVFDDLTATDD